MPFVASTLSTAVRYNKFESRGNDVPSIVHSVTIAGGANVANKKTLITPLGVITRVSDEDAKFLSQNRLFNLHKQNGFVQILDKDPGQDVEKVVASDMAHRDYSAPLVPGEERDAVAVVEPVEPAAPIRRGTKSKS